LSEQIDDPPGVVKSLDGFWGMKLFSYELYEDTQDENATRNGQNPRKDGQ
jgi:hypothetical protein